MYLPDRYNSDTILDADTKVRIDQSDYVILFALTPNLSTIVKAEIEYAFDRLRDKSKIIVIYGVQKHLKGSMTDHFTEIYYNPLKDTPDVVIEEVFKKVFEHQQKEIQTKIQSAENQKLKTKIKQLEQEKKEQNALLALLGIGLGLAILASFSKE
ncbi:MAG: hypothetical protein HUU01_09310 [Saprospiraceae bacterium]|nr:hypothetical protein [Saprospiraceae bacterium]